MFSFFVFCNLYHFLLFGFFPNCLFFYPIIFIWRDFLFLFCIFYLKNWILDLLCRTILKYSPWFTCNTFLSLNLFFSVFFFNKFFRKNEERRLGNRYLFSLFFLRVGASFVFFSFFRVGFGFVHSQSRSLILICTWPCVTVRLASNIPSTWLGVTVRLASNIPSTWTHFILDHL